jgi:hypothetical protein
MERRGAVLPVRHGRRFAMKEVLREDFMAKKTRTINMNRLGWALNELKDPPIQSLYVYHSNPAAVTPDQNQVLKGLVREDLFTVVHERFMTDTARYADIVLPSTSSLEHSDLYAPGTLYTACKSAILRWGRNQTGCSSWRKDDSGALFRQTADLMIIFFPYPALCEKESIKKLFQPERQSKFRFHPTRALVSKPLLERSNF